MPTTPSVSSDAILQIMQRHDVRVTPDEFQNAVNVTFHEFESEVYDNEHSDMWNSLPQQFELLVDDCLQQCKFPNKIRLLDIGCGTGLAFSCLLRTSIGKHIESLDILDTSPAMLRLATERARQNGLPVTPHLGLLDALSRQNKYDLVVTCSVLHHVPDVQRFLRQVSSHQAENGIFLHLQDPNGDFLEDSELKARVAQAASRPLPNFVYRFRPAKVFRRLSRMVRARKPEDYISRTNDALVRNGIIATPLSAAELFSITDIHVHDGEGVSLSKMRDWMNDYQCIAHRSYGFYGQLWSALPDKLRKEEERLIRERAKNGFHVAAAWQFRRGASMQP